jgi:fatty-acyl-CoA synthase
MSAFRPIHGVTVGDLLARAAAELPGHEAVAFPDLGVQLSFGDLERTARQLARGLLAHGICKGDRVAVWAPNLPEWVAIQFALAKIGAILVTVNTGHRRLELEQLLDHCGAKTLVLAGGVKGTDFFALLADLVPELASSVPGKLRSSRFPLLETVVSLGDEVLAGARPWAELLASGAAVAESALRQAEESLDPDDVINMQYTSGTTGWAKGVMLSHRNIVENAYTVGQHFDLRAGDRLCCPVPFFHCFGCVLGILTPLSHGIPTVPCVQFTGERALSLVARERCTVIYGVPTMFIAELEAPGFGSFDLRSLRSGVMAGAPCPPDLFLRVVREMHCAGLAVGYGLTEASPAVTFSDPADPPEERAQTVGRAIAEVEVSIREIASDRSLPPSTQGEICVRGPFVMKGYYRDPEATARMVDEEGWLHTGDLGSLDERGRLRVTGRAKEMIIRGGENVYPREIEEYLRGYPGVADVAVFGVACRRHGEDVAVAIRTRGEQPVRLEDLQRFCKGRLADHKIPVVALTLAEFPMTGSGKIQKFKLREQAEDATGGECAGHERA